MAEKSKREPIEGYACFILLALICIVMGLEVVARYVFNSSFRWAAELSRFLFIWFIFVGSSYAIVKNTHIRIEAIFSFLPKKLQPHIEFFGNILWFVFSLLIAYLGFDYSINMLSEGTNLSSAMRIPMGIIYIAIPVGYVLMAMRLLLVSYQNFKWKQKSDVRG